MAKQMKAKTKLISKWKESKKAKGTGQSGKKPSVPKANKLVGMHSKKNSNK